MRRLICLVLAATLSAVASAAVATPHVEDGFTFAAGGDLIGPNQALELKQYLDPALEAVAQHFRQADMGFANVEGSLFDLSTFKGWPAAETGGGYPLGPAEVAKDLRFLGITLVSKANNHATDFGTLGLVATLASLKAAGIVQAGAGMDLAQARAPAFIKTPKGEIALVDTASTFTPMSVAGAPEPKRPGQPIGGRPGISVVHVREVHLLPYAQFDQLRNLIGGVAVMSRPQTWSGEPAGVPADRGVDLELGNVVFRGAAKIGLTWEMDTQDVSAVLGSVKEARRTANFVLFSMHAHEITPYPSSEIEKNLNTARPADFEVRLFHAAIDAGADAVVRNGPHVLGGIEIYKGKPIFYGLGSLFFQFGGSRSYRVPGGAVLHFSDAWFQTVVPVTTYENGKVSEIRLYPVVIESSKTRTDGRPRPADHAQAQIILDRVRALSARYGTKVEIVNDVGVIRGPGI